MTIILTIWFVLSSAAFAWLFYRHITKTIEKHNDSIHFFGINNSRNEKRCEELERKVELYRLELQEIQGKLSAIQMRLR